MSRVLSRKAQKCVPDLALLSPTVGSLRHGQAQDPASKAALSKSANGSRGGRTYHADASFAFNLQGQHKPTSFSARSPQMHSSSAIQQTSLVDQSAPKTQEFKSDIE